MSLHDGSTFNPPGLDQASNHDADEALIWDQIGTLSAASPDCCYSCGTVLHVASCSRGAFNYRRREMDWNVIEGNWKQSQGKIRQKWGKLTDDDLTRINGQREQLEGIIQQRYGLARDKVRQDVDAWLKTQP
jgi:uncharacterized protein YjbJ (UPF0337 family)